MKHSDLSAVLSRQNMTEWLRTTLAMAVAMAMAGTLRAAPYTWDGNGDVNASGNWSTIANWNPDSTAGRPSNLDDVTLPDVTTGERTITFDGTGTGARTLTITQTTVGATNKLVLSQNMVNGQFAWAVNGLTRNLNPAGTIVIDKGSYNFQPWWGSGQASPTATLGANVIVNSTGGSMQDMWDGPNTPLTFQGTLNLSSGVTTFGSGNTMTLDTGGTLNLTSGGGASVGNTGTMTIKGTVNGNSTGSLRARTVILEAGSAMPTSVAEIYANNLSIRSAAPASFDLSGTTLRRAAGGTTTADLEVAASGAGTNFKIGTFSFNNTGMSIYDGLRMRLVNDYANSANQASEYFLLGAINGSGAYQQEFDLNGQRLVIDGGVGSFVNTGSGGLRLSNRSAGHGVMEFRTLGGNLNLGNSTSLGVSNGGTLEIIGPASISNLRMYNPGNALGSVTGSIVFNGNVATASAMSVTLNSAAGTNTLDLAGANTLTMNAATIAAVNGATFILNGHVTGESRDAIGLRALGTAKSGTGTPVVTPGGTIIVIGNVTHAGQGLSTHIGRDATLKVGGDFAAGYWWNGISGAANRSFFADTSPHAGSFVFDGGATFVQNMEILSNGHAVITGLSFLSAPARRRPLARRSRAGRPVPPPRSTSSTAISSSSRVSPAPSRPTRRSPSPAAPPPAPTTPSSPG